MSSEAPRSYYTFIFYSIRRRKFHVGYSISPEESLSRKNFGKTRWESWNCDWEMKFVRAHETKREARQLMAEIKKGQTPASMATFVRGPLNELETKWEEASR